jgi:transcriptional regulator with XRE-family HTH domain
MIQLGMTIKRLRLEQGMSQKALAEQANLTPSFVSLIENDHRVPSVAVIGRMASALGIPDEVLIWDAVELPRNLNENDRRLCEMAKLIVRRFYESRDDDPSGEESEVPSTHRDAG